jgi:hypothetical protein
MAAVALVLAAGALPGCSGGGVATPIPPSAPALSLDCTASSPACLPLAIAGDELATLPNGRPSPVRGHGDPSLRRDPSGAGLWLGYSWVHPAIAGSRIVGAEVDTRLAHSDDGGQTWSLVATLWRSDSGARDPTGRPGHLNSETVSLAPRPTGAGTAWYSARFVYFTPDEGGPQVGSFTIHVAAAGSPQELGGAPEAVLGGDLTNPFWRPDVNLAELTNGRPEDSLAGCTFYDAGLFYREGRLWMAVQCALYGGGGKATEDEFVALFSTVPDGPPSQWPWRYLGRLAGRADAVALGGQMLQQADLALAQDGAVLAIVSPSAPPAAGATLDQHFGCRMIEVGSLDPPRLARDAAGTLRVRATVTASDLVAPDGSPASCGYDAASATGVVIARRDDRNGLGSALYRTGLRP